MAELKCVTCSNDLQVTNYPILVSGAKNVDTFSVVFDDTWLSVPTATQYRVFFANECEDYSDSVELAMAGNTGTCTIPDEALAKSGILQFNVACMSQNGDVLRLSNVKRHPVVYGYETDSADDDLTINDVKRAIVEVLNERYGTSYSSGTDISVLIEFLNTVQTASETRSNIITEINSKFTLSLPSDASETDIITAIDAIPLGLKILDARTYEEVTLTRG